MSYRAEEASVEGDPRRSGGVSYSHSPASFSRDSLPSNLVFLLSKIMLESCVSQLMCRCPKKK